MSILLKVVFVVILLASVAMSQDLSRDQKIKNIFDLHDQITALEQEIMVPDANDIELAQKQGLTALRLLPRQPYEKVLTTRGGGAYYSFLRKTHEYGYGSDIELQQGKLSVGFAGADYGFIADMGNIPLTSVSLDNADIVFLVNYQPPTEMTEIRKEQAKSRNYETPTATFSSSVTAMVGHSYALRSLGFDQSDVLIAFKVVRRDVDGSLILFWKLLKTYDKPIISKESVKN